MNTALAKLSHAERALAEAKTLDDLVAIRDTATAAKAYAEAAKLGTAAINHATEVKLRAERRAGEMLREMAKRGERAGLGRPSNKGRTAPFLSDLGISVHESKAWQRVADVPEPEFEDRLAEVKENGQRLSRAAVLSYVEVNNRSEGIEWYTQARYIESARRVLGGVIDLDPASNATANEIVRARRFFTQEDDGLSQDWSASSLFMNPPFGELAGRFIAKLVDEIAAGRAKAAIALVSAHATDTTWFQPLWDGLLCFTIGRNVYYSTDRESTPTFGSVFAYFGPHEDGFHREFQQYGPVVRRLS
jgi:hypothetical protein